MRKGWGIFCLLIMVLCSLSACGGVLEEKSRNADHRAEIASEDAVPVSSRKAQEVSVERKDCKVDLQISAKEQLKQIYQQKSLWYWEPKNAEDEDVEIPKFAVTDFDQNGYLEIYVIEDSQGQPALYEFNRQGSELVECKLTEEVFQELTYNPVCAYQEKETEKWHLGRNSSEQKGEVKEFYMQYDPTPFLIDEESTEGENIEELLYSWEDFAVYEALDVSGWEKKLTEQERRQLRLMADTMGNFGTADRDAGMGYLVEYAVCDLNQDGSLELLVRFCVGSGIVREFYQCYALDAEGIKVVMKGEGTRRVFPKDASEDEQREAEKNSVQTRDSAIYGYKSFLYTAQDFHELSCYQDADSGEIRYVFEAKENRTGSEGVESDSLTEPYEMYWSGHGLFIESPEEKSSKGAGKQGKANFRWMERCSMACPDYQYENVLASYLGWELRWMEAKHNATPVPIHVLDSATVVSVTERDLTDITLSEEEEFVQINNNIVNGNFIHPYQGGYFYYVEKGGDGPNSALVYKDGQGKILEQSDLPSILYHSGDTFYYHDLERHELKRWGDGKAQTIVKGKNDSYLYVSLAKEGIYYAEVDQENKITNLSLVDDEGKTIQQLYTLDVDIMQLFFYEDELWFTFQEFDDENYIERLGKLNLNNRQVSIYHLKGIADGKVYLSFQNGYLYIQSSDLKRLHIQNNTIERVYPKRVDCLNFTEDGILFARNKKLYRLNQDGIKKILELDSDFDGIGGIHVEDKKIYLSTYAGAFFENVVQIDIDGTIKQKIYNGEWYDDLLG